MNKRNWSTKRNWSWLTAAVICATAMFWVTMLTAPPKSEAALQGGISQGNPNMADVIDRLSLTADPNMPSFEDKYQRHMGVLDVLKP